ncbi:hypothetical protein [Colwellia sp. UCD-KL20]|uniref:hypothetical protein n=1 Tax=Colwellia sp. UCD-KL20 TaxID=1917165 RepID=UPI0009713CDE|nr:hypothetical protein [Colwellia sp. UCD-KL20]
MSKYGFSIYNLVIALILFAGTFANLEYDDGSIGALYYLVIFPVFGFVFHFTHELLFSLNNGESFPYQPLVAFIVGMLFSALVDFLRYKYKNRTSVKVGI